MTREFILNQMTFPEFMLYYAIGTKEHLKLNGLYANPETEETVDLGDPDECDHEQLYEMYHNRQYDPSSFADLM